MENRSFKVESLIRMARCKQYLCDCNYNLTRPMILEMLDELTDSLVLLAGLRAEYRIKMHFTQRLGKVFRITVFFGEENPMQESMTVTIHRKCDLKRFYEYGMLLSRFYRMDKFGEIPNDDTCNRDESFETITNTCTSECSATSNEKCENDETINFQIYMPR